MFSTVTDDLLLPDLLEPQPATAPSARTPASAITTVRLTRISLPEFARGSGGCREQSGCRTGKGCGASGRDPAGSCPGLGYGGSARRRRAAWFLTRCGRTPDHQGGGDRLRLVGQYRALE